MSFVCIRAVLCESVCIYVCVCVEVRGLTIRRIPGCRPHCSLWPFNTHTHPPAAWPRQAWWCPPCDCHKHVGPTGLWCHKNVPPSRPLLQTLLTPCQPAAERIRLYPKGHTGHGWTNLGRREVGGEEGDTTALSVSGVSLVLSNIKDTWPVCLRLCVPMCL